MDSRDGRRTSADLGDALLSLVVSADSFEAALSSTLRLVCRTADWSYGEVWSLDSTDGVLRLQSTWTTDSAFEAFAAASADTTFERGVGLPGRVWRDGESEWISDLSSATTETFGRAALAAEHGFGAAVAVPIVAEGDAVAVLLFVTDDRRDADDEFVDILTDTAGRLGTLLADTRARERLERERNAFETVIENSPAPMVVIEADGTVSRVNRRFEELLATSREEVVGRRITDDVWRLADGDGDPLDPREGPSSVALREGRAVSDTAIELAFGDGEPRSLVANATPVFGEDDRPERVVTAYVDVTDQRAREAELEAKNAQLEAFASIVAHDLRNPLAIASGFAELAEETGDPDHFDRVDRAHERMSTLIADLLLLARQGRAIGDRSEVDVGVVARSAWAGVDAGGATFTVEPDTGTVSADTGRLTQLFENLFRNSVEHGSTSSRTESDDSVEHGSTGNRTSSGDSVEHDSTSSRTESDDSVEHGSTGNRTSSGDSVEHAGDDVTVRVGPLDDGRGFYVADDGPGVPASRQASLLRSTDDGGLGLKIVAAIAEGHGWTVNVDDADPDADPPGLRLEFHVDSAAAEDVDGTDGDGDGADSRVDL